MDFHIRPIVAADLRECGRICYEAFKIVNERHGFPTRYPSIEAGEARVRGMFNAASTLGLVADSEGKIGGFAFLTERDEVRAIGLIAIEGSVQSRGIGRLLMATLLERARQASSIRLVRAAFNLQSLSLYASLGFDVRDQLIVMTGRPKQSVAKGYLVRRLEEKDLAECDALHVRLLGYSRTNELRDRLAEGTPLVVVHADRVAGYIASPARVSDNHGVAETDEAMQSLLCGAAELTDAPLSFLLPTSHADLFRWCLREGLRAVRPMTLMTIGEYTDPRGVYVPSMLY